MSSESPEPTTSAEDDSAKVPLPPGGSLSCEGYDFNAHSSREPVPERNLGLYGCWLGSLAVAEPPGLSPLGLVKSRDVRCSFPVHLKLRLGPSQKFLERRSCREPLPSSSAGVC